MQQAIFCCHNCIIIILLKLCKCCQRRQSGGKCLIESSRHQQQQQRQNSSTNFGECVCVCFFIIIVKLTGNWHRKNHVSRLLAKVVEQGQPAGSKQKKNPHKETSDVCLIKYEPRNLHSFSLCYLSTFVLISWIYFHRVNFKCKTTRDAARSKNNWWRLFT